MLQRKPEKMGKSLAKTTGWIHRLHLRGAGVEMLTGVEYIKIDDAGLHIRHGGERQLLKVDTVITCTGQQSNSELLEVLQQHKFATHVIGGAAKAAELDAESAIRQATELALSL
jgi:2,4-dienoyl-CoA reductase (NADPH2)